MAALVIIARASTLTRPPTCTSAATYARSGSTSPEFGHGHSFASGAAESRAGLRKGRVDEPDFEAAQGQAPMTADELAGMRPSSASCLGGRGIPADELMTRGRGVFAQACSAARMWTFHYERMRKMPLSRLNPKWVDLKRRITWGKEDEASVVRKIEAAPTKNHNKESVGGGERERGRDRRQREGDRTVTVTVWAGPTERERRGEGGENAKDGKHRAAHVHHARHAPRRSSAYAAGERVHLSKESREVISKEETEAWMGLLLGRRACLPMHQALSEQKEQLAEGSLRWGAKPDLLADASKDEVEGVRGRTVDVEGGRATKEAKIERDKDPRVQLLAGRADGDAGAGQVSDTL
ncbi:hypothetical protein K438DRAFT_1782832 [Mycena galopus ATCC 62051]|nr:hypothetical protein K438DRAFT_1782832 [Mycena galopus ATCC 62051]